MLIQYQSSPLMNADAAKFISEHTKAGQVILMKLNFFSEVEKM